MPQITSKELPLLLNEESFMRWLKNEAEPNEREKWEQWRSENQYHKILEKKAKKIVNMPFNDWSSQIDTEEELEKISQLLTND